MNILHLNDMAGVAFTLARAQREAGHEAEVFNLDALRPGLIKWNWAIVRNQSLFDEADIIHVHGGIRLTQLALRHYRGKIVVHLHGTETRTGEGLHHLKLASRILCATPDLTRDFPQAEYIPNPLGIEQRMCEYTDYGPVLVGHFPSNPVTKGTALIQEAMARMATADLVVVQGASHEQALAVMEECDIVIDHMNPVGAYGTVTLEALAMGKPVICCLDPSLYPETPPIAAVDPEYLTVDALRYAIWDLIEARQKWPQRGERGRRYLDAFHNRDVVSRRVLGVYREVLDGQYRATERAKEEIDRALAEVEEK